MYEEISRVEMASLNAWPARQQALLWGWLLRVHDGYTRRANSVQALLAPAPGVQPPPLQERIQAVEEFYGRHGQPAIFKLTPLVEPPELDAVLARRGYRREAPTGVWVRSLASLPVPVDVPGCTLHVDEEVRGEWLSTFLAFSEAPPQVYPSLRDILTNITAQRGLFMLRQEDAPVALALAVREGDLLGVFDVVVAPSARGQGLGRVLLDRLLVWGTRQGARLAYLQVMDDNQPARRLYTRLGFRPLYQYWYRVRGDWGN